MDTIRRTLIRWIRYVPKASMVNYVVKNASRENWKRFWSLRMGYSKWFGIINRELASYGGYAAYHWGSLTVEM